jgi:hypothetical protein
MSFTANGTSDRLDVDFDEMLLSSRCSLPVAGLRVREGDVVDEATTEDKIEVASDMMNLPFNAESMKPRNLSRNSLVAPLPTQLSLKSDSCGRIDSGFATSKTQSRFSVAGSVFEPHWERLSELRTQREC